MKKRDLHRLLKGTGAACAAALMVGNAMPATAQITEERTHSYRSFDVKNYAIDKIPDRSFCVLAGTVFDPGGTDDNSINMMVTQNFPGVIGNTITNRQFDDPGFDERAIGVHYVESRTDDIVVVASRLDLMGGTDESNIEILRMDDRGNLRGSFIVRDRNNRMDLHAMSTLLVENDLYICGFTTALGTPVHNYRTPKKVFVVRFDLNSNTVTNSQTFDYDYPGMEYDYDMATRMKLLSTGDIYVTGSTSGNYVNTPPPNWDPLSAGYYCATLSLVLDRGLNTRSDLPFSEFRPTYGGWPSPDRMTAGEYGFDVVEDAGSGGYFVFGNTYVGSHPDPNPLLQFFTITYVDPQWRIPGTLRNRFRGPNFDYAWGIGVEKGNNPGWFVLNGVETDRYWQFSSGPFNWLPTSMDNINPFLTELRPDYSTGALNVVSNYWSIILSADGTGSRSLYPNNNYYDLRGFKSHIAWSPRSLTRGFDWTNDIFLSSPVWNHDGYNKLNMKTIRTDRFGRMTNDCPFDYTYTLSGVTYDTYESVDGDRQDSDFAEQIAYTEPETDFNPDYIIDCRGSGIYKPTGIGNAASVDYHFSISPNPARESIAVVLEGSISQENVFEVVLTDMAGRSVANLYRGNKDGLDKIALPQLAPGSYLVSVTGKESGKLQSRLLIIK